MAVLLTPPYLQFFDANGDPLVNGKLYTYTATGTFSVGKATFTTEAGNIQHPNPIILDAAGRPATGNGSVWINGTYDFKVTDALDNIVETTLNVTSFNTLPPASDAYFQSFSGNGSQTAFVTSQSLGTDEKAIYVWIDNGLTDHVGYQIQNPSTYTINGTTLTFSVAPAAGTGNIYVSAPSLLVGAAATAAAAAADSAADAAADVVLTHADVVTTHADVVTTNADVALTHADVVLTHADVVTTHADVITAGNSASNASTSATNANNSAIAAAASAAALAGGLSGTSTTSLTIGTGSKTFTTQANKLFVSGQILIVASNANVANYMHGSVTSYSGTTLVMSITDISGSGTFADWNISVSGTQGTSTGISSITAGAGLSGGTITSSGTIAVDIANTTGASIATADRILFSDTSSSNVIRQDTVSNLLALNPGTLVPLNTQNASSSSSILFDNTYITSTYRSYIIRIINANIATSTTSLAMYFSSDNGSTYITALIYEHLTCPTANSNSYVGIGASGVDFARLHPTDTNGIGYSGVIELFDLASTTDRKEYITTGAFFQGTAVTTRTASGGVLNSTNAINNIKIAALTGAISTGRFELYGVL